MPVPRPLIIWPYKLPTSRFGRAPLRRSIAASLTPLADWVRRFDADDRSKTVALALRKSPDAAARFTESLRIRCPASLPVAIDAAAARNLMTASEYVRRSVIERLRADGIDLEHAASVDAGKLR